MRVLFAALLALLLLGCPTSQSTVTPSFPPSPPNPLANPVEAPTQPALPQPRTRLNGIDFDAPLQRYASHGGRDCGFVVTEHVNPTPETLARSVDECMTQAFHVCSPAMALQFSTTIEGETVITFLAIDGPDEKGCRLQRVVASGDSFGKPGNFEGACYAFNEEYPFGSCYYDTGEYQTAQ